MPISVIVQYCTAPEVVLSAKHRISCFSGFSAAVLLINWSSTFYQFVQAVVPAGTSRYYDYFGQIEITVNWHCPLPAWYLQHVLRMTNVRSIELRHLCKNMSSIGRQDVFSLTYTRFVSRILTYTHSHSRHSPG